MLYFYQHNIYKKMYAKYKIFKVTFAKQSVRIVKNLLN